MQYVAVMRHGRVVELDAALAIHATATGLWHMQPLADSVICATAQSVNATVWTQYADFLGLPGLRYWPAGGREA